MDNTDWLSKEYIYISESSLCQAVYSNTRLSSPVISIQYSKIYARIYKFNVFL